MKSRSLQPQSIFDQEALLNAFIKRNIPKVNARHLWRLIIQQGVTSYHDIPDEKLSKAAKRCLDEEFTLCTSQIVKQTTSSDGTTTKLLVKLQDGLHIEAVIMRYQRVGGKGDCSSSFGCVGCSCHKPFTEHRLITSITYRYGHGEMSNFPDEERDKRREAARKESGREYKSVERATLCVSS